MTSSSPTVTTASISAIGARLAPSGLNRCQAIATSTLTNDVWLPGHKPSWADQDAGTEATLLLVGHGGKRLWQHLSRTGSGTHSLLEQLDDPFDTFSIDETTAALEAELPNTERQLLYPHPDCPVDLVALGHGLGWQSSSPLGLGISPEFGLWSAFRTLWLLRASAPDLQTPPTAVDVCAACETRECVVACPASAVTDGRFNLQACFAYRAEPTSQCGETCLSRQACPEGSQHRYSPGQMAYHYQISRPAIRSGAQQEGAGDGPVG